MGVVPWQLVFRCCRWFSATTRFSHRQSIANANKGSAPFRWIATTDLSLERLERLCSQNSGTGDRAQRAPQQKAASGKKRLSDWGSRLELNRSDRI